MKGQEAVLRYDLSRRLVRMIRCLSETTITFENLGVGKSVMAWSLHDDLARAAQYINHAFQDPEVLKTCNMEMLEDEVVRTVQTFNSLSGLALKEANVWLQVPWSSLPGNLVLRTFPSFVWHVLGAGMGYLQIDDKNVILSCMSFGDYLFRWELNKRKLQNHGLSVSEGLLVQFCHYLRFSAYVSSHDHVEALKRGLEYAEACYGGRFLENFGGLHQMYVYGNIANQFAATGDFDKAEETSRKMLKIAAEQQIHGTTLKKCLFKAAAHLPAQEAVDVLELATEWKSRSELRVEGEGSCKESLAAMTRMLGTYCDLQRFKEAAQLVQWIDHTAEMWLAGDKDPKGWRAWLIRKRMFYQYTGNIVQTDIVCSILAEEGEDPSKYLADSERFASEGDFENAIVALNKCPILGAPELERRVTVPPCSSDPQISDRMWVPVLYTTRGIYRLALEQCDEALADLEEGLRIAKKYYGPESERNRPCEKFPASYLCQAECLLKMGRIEEAQSRLGHALSLAPEGSNIRNEVDSTHIRLLLAARKPEDAAAKGRENFLKFAALQSGLGRGMKAEWESFYDTSLGASAQDMECIHACDEYWKQLVWTERRHMRLFMFETEEKNIEEFNRFDKDDEYARSVIVQAAERCVNSSTAIIVHSVSDDQSHVHMFIVTRVAKDGNLAPTLDCSHCLVNFEPSVNDPENWCSLDRIVEFTSDAKDAITCKEDSKSYLQNLYQFFVEFPLEKFLKLPDSIDTYLFSVHGEFSKVPFAALHDYRDQKFLIQKKCVGIIPGFRALHHCFKKQDLFYQNYATAKLCPPFVAGNPSPMKLGLSKLRRAEKEAQEVARIFGVMPCVGSKMTKRDVKAGLENSSLVLIATHGDVGQDDESHGSLVMQASESLTGSEISDLKVGAGLVILSACRSGDGKVTREGLLGLGRAVLLAGAPTVIVTLWKVNDNATKTLVIEVMKEFCKGEKTVNECLQLAMQQMIKDGKSVYEWAPMVVLGSPTMRWPCNELAPDLTKLLIN